MENRIRRNLAAGVISRSSCCQPRWLPPSHPACSSGCPDSDGDGLNDAWEIAGGIDLNNDGVVDP
jgi:hypothetical protein